MLWKKRILFAVYFWGAIALSLLVSMLGVFLVRFFTQEKLPQLIIEALLHLANTIIIWGVFHYRDGYGSGHPFGKNELLTHLVAFAINIIGGFIFQNAVYVSGAAYFITHILWLQTGHDVIGIGSAPLWLYTVFMLLCDGIYLLFGWLAYRLGGYIRTIEKQKLTKGKTN